MKKLSEKQMHNRLNKYYIQHYGEDNEIRWYVNPEPNIWKFERDGKIIILVCDECTGKVTEQ